MPSTSSICAWSQSGCQSLGAAHLAVAGCRRMRDVCGSNSTGSSGSSGSTKLTLLPTEAYVDAAER